VGYGDYLEQITYLLFLKMADKLNKSPTAGLYCFKEIMETINGDE